MSISTVERAGFIKKIKQELNVDTEFAEAKLKVLESYGDDYLPYLESWYKCAPINGEVSTEVDGETIKVTIFEIQQILCNHYLDAVSYLHFFTNHPDMIEFLKMGFFNCK